MYETRKQYYEELEKEFDGIVLSYITSDRPNFETQIAQDTIDLFINQLDRMGPVKRIILYLYTRGGDTAAAWNIVNLLRMFGDELVVVIPHKAHSAGTIICLGADKIIMTKQATLGPIDPSLNSPLNPRIPDDPLHRTVPVSVEAVEGYIQFAKDELQITNEQSLFSVLNKLTDYVHPLVLGQVYRSRSQIKMLATKLLQHQIHDDAKVQKIIAFLCSDSGSHDYTINRREAKDELSLNVEKPSDPQYRIIKALYDDFSQELGLHEDFDITAVQGEYSVRRGFVESIQGGSDYYVTEGRIQRGVNEKGLPFINNQKMYEGWRHEDSVKEVSSRTSNQSETTETGEVKYEKTGEYGL